MAVVRRDIINTPAFARAAVVARHPPAEHIIHNKQWQVYGCCNETTRVSTPRLVASDWAASPGSDSRVIAACEERAANSGISNISKFAVVDIERRNFQHPAVKAILQIKVTSAAPRRLQK